MTTIKNTAAPKSPAVANKTAFVADICTALSVHAQIEEEIFYPAAGMTARRDELLAQKA